MRALPLMVCRSRCKRRGKSVFDGSLRQLRTPSLIERIKSTLSSRKMGSNCGSISSSIRWARRSSSDSGMSAAAVTGAATGWSAVLPALPGACSTAGPDKGTATSAPSASASSSSALGRRRSLIAPSMPSSAPAVRANTKRCSSVGAASALTMRSSASSSARPNCCIACIPVVPEIPASVWAARTRSSEGILTSPISRCMVAR